MKLSALIPELYCTDIHISKNFYMDALGFHVLYERPEEGFAMMEREDAQIMLDELRVASRKWITAPLEYPFGRGSNIQIDVNNVDKLYQKARAANAKIFLEIEEKWYRANNVQLGCRQFLVQDPDGHLLRFSQDLGEKPA